MPAVILFDNVVVASAAVDDVVVRATKEVEALEEEMDADAVDRAELSAADTTELETDDATAVDCVKVAAVVACVVETGVVSLGQ